MLQYAQPNSGRLLFLLLITDMVFVTMHIVLIRLGFDPLLFSLQADLGMPEIFQYLKEFWIFLLLAMAGIRLRNWVFGSWACLFLYLLIDDSLQIHETLGLSLARQFDLRPFLGLRPEDFGELIVSFFFGGFLMSIVMAAYVFSDGRSRLHSRNLFYLIICIAFFGIVIDMVHVALPGIPGLAVLEDGGEMVVMSVIMWYVFDLDQVKTVPEGGVEKIERSG